MSVNSQGITSVDLEEVEESLLLFVAKLNKNHQQWISIQYCIPYVVLVLCVVSVIATLLTRSYVCWVFTSPAICVLMVLEVIIDEVLFDLLLVADEARYLLCMAGNVCTKIYY